MPSRTRLAWLSQRAGTNLCGQATSAASSYPRLLPLAALLAVLTPCALAQKTTSAHAAHRSSRTHRSSPLTSFLSPFLGDSFNPDDLSLTGAPSQAPPFLLQATRALSGTAGFAGPSDNGHHPSSSEPLLIELQGDRYVRVTSAAIDGEALPLRMAPPNNGQLNNAHPSKSGSSHLTKPSAHNSAPSPAPITAAAPPARNLPPAVLVFRDGHSEEVHDYTIADGVLYARGDFYTDGYWNKKIDLSALNLTATMQTNSTHNLKFVIPSSPNEVITRP